MQTPLKLVTSALASAVFLSRVVAGIVCSKDEDCNISVDKDSAGLEKQGQDNTAKIPRPQKKVSNRKKSKPKAKATKRKNHTAAKHAKKVAKTTKAQNKQKKVTNKQNNKTRKKKRKN